MSNDTVNKDLLGARGFLAFIKANGGILLVAAHPEGRIFRGEDAARAVRAAGFEVQRWTGPRDAKVSDASWESWKHRSQTYIALRPIGKVAV